MPNSYFLNKLVRNLHLVIFSIAKLMDFSPLLSALEASSSVFAKEICCILSFTQKSFSKNNSNVSPSTFSNEAALSAVTLRYNKAVEPIMYPSDWSLSCKHREPPALLRAA